MDKGKEQIKKMVKNNIAKVLGYIWTLGKEEGVPIRKEAVNEEFKVEIANNLLEDMSRTDIIDIDNQNVTLTSVGTKQAELIIRRHRLAERLFFDVLDSDPDEYESNTCKFDLYVADDIVAGICTLLGHPITCPHGNLIPRSDCCVKAEKELKSLMFPLSGLRPGNSCKVIHIDTMKYSRSGAPIGFRILPGANLRVRQIEPAFIVQIDDSYITIDKNSADQIYVRSIHH